MIKRKPRVNVADRLKQPSGSVESVNHFTARRFCGKPCEYAAKSKTKAPITDYEDYVHDCRDTKEFRYFQRLVRRFIYVLASQKKANGKCSYPELKAVLKKRRIKVPFNLLQLTEAADRIQLDEFQVARIVWRRKDYRFVLSYPNLTKNAGQVVRVAV
jgi:hypothetical protein